MGDAQNTVWLFLKNFSNKFSISDLVNGNERKGNGTRKSITYNRLQTHDKSDFLSSSNPNLLDIVGKAEEKGQDGKKDHLNSPPQPGSSSKDKHKAGKVRCDKPAEGKSHARKFTFKVSDEGRRSQDPDDSDDSNWIECDEEDDDDNSSEYAEEEEDARRCGYCGCEKKYVVAPQ